MADNFPISDAEREILRPLWKIHILHHASEGPIIGNWMLEELREHGHRVSPGTLYPLLSRMEKLGWLKREQDRRPRRPGKSARPFRTTGAGRQVLREVKARLRELSAEMPYGGTR